MLSWEIRDFVNFKWLENVSHGSVAIKLNKLTFVSISHDDSKSETGFKYELFRVLKPLFSFIGLQFLYSRNDIYLIWRLVNLYMYLICIYKSVIFFFSFQLVSFSPVDLDIQACLVVKGKCPHVKVTSTELVSFWNKPKVIKSVVCYIFR